MKESVMLLKKIDENLWTYDGEVVSFYGYPYSTRMTVIRINKDELWIHSPEKLNPTLQEELQELGQVKYLISPNKLHHLYLVEWIAAYPEVKNYAAPGLIKKRRDITFNKELSNTVEAEWQAEIHQLIFEDSFAMREVVFYHIASKTLILTDLIENFSESHFTGWQKLVARLAGIISPNGKAPLDFRSTFIFGKARARKALAVILAWQPQNIIISHGECIFGNGTEFLQKSFSWV